MKKWLAGLMLLLLFLGPFPALAGVPLDTVKNNVNGVLDVLRDPKLQGEAGKKLKEQRIAAAADKLFDFVELSKRTPGLNWNSFLRMGSGTGRHDPRGAHDEPRQDRA